MEKSIKINQRERYFWMFCKWFVLYPKDVAGANFSWCLMQISCKAPLGTFKTTLAVLKQAALIYKIRCISAFFIDDGLTEELLLYFVSARELIQGFIYAMNVLCHWVAPTELVLCSFLAVLRRLAACKASTLTFCTISQDPQIL